MAGFSLTAADRFPAGTSVGAYPASNWPQSQLPPSGSPPGSATATASMSTAGTAAFTGLADGTRYFAGADVSGTWRYVAFSTPAAAAGAALTWVALTLGTGITSFGTPYAATPAAALDSSGSVVHLQGLIQGSASGGSVVATLPSASMYPASQRAVVGLNANDGDSIRGMTVRADGTIRNAGNWTAMLVSLDDISYPIGGA